MGKRSNFKRIPRDFYPTPYEAVIPLLAHISGSFCEPCAGDGALVHHLQRHGHKCTFSCDVAPQAPGIEKFNALDMGGTWGAHFIVTNPPWRREMLHPMIRHFRMLAPTWLIFDAAWAFTGQAAPFLNFCEKIVTVGRVKWIPGSKSAGKEDVAWYKFVDHEVETVFVGKTEKKTCDKTAEMFDARIPDRASKRPTAGQK